MGVKIQCGVVGDTCSPEVAEGLLVAFPPCAESLRIVRGQAEAPQTGFQVPSALQSGQREEELAFRAVARWVVSVAPNPFLEGREPRRGVCILGRWKGKGGPGDGLMNLQMWCQICLLSIFGWLNHVCCECSLWNEKLHASKTINN